MKWAMLDHAVHVVTWWHGRDMGIAEQMLNQFLTWGMLNDEECQALRLTWARLSPEVAIPAVAVQLRLI